MKRTLILLFALLSLNMAYGQDKRQTVAIYTEDQSGKGYGDFGVEFITNAIVKRGNYDVVDVTAGFQRLVAAERNRQTSGSVSDAQIRKLGEESGAELICAVKIGIVDGKYYISGRFIAVESKGVPISARPKFFNSVSDGFEDACETITASMFGERGSGGGSRSNASSGNTQRHPAEPEMISVQGGTFWMGCSGEQGSDCESDESPLHSVTVSNFQIGKYEVTQKQWQLIMGTTVEQQRVKAGGSATYGVGDNFPVYYVSWEEAQEFISRLNAATGKQYRLPTEAEWEYAARGGNKSQGYKYSGSYSADAVAWYKDNSGSTNHAVGTKLPNELGIYDMSGSVWEWCFDWYGSYQSSSQTNTKGASTGSRRVLRGGCWFSYATRCRVSYRSNYTPSSRYSVIGFRVALSL